jgi:hypothetical protein
MEMILHLSPTVSSYPATGGNLAHTSGSYRFHIFTASGTFTTLAALTGLDIVVIGGGGAPGSRWSGGGGAGGIVVASSVDLGVGTYAVVRGAGGTGVTDETVGDNGDDSSFITDSFILSCNWW